jgi:hypothetical protein
MNGAGRETGQRRAGADLTVFTAAQAAATNTAPYPAPHIGTVGGSGATIDLMHLWGYVPGSFGASLQFPTINGSGGTNYKFGAWGPPGAATMEWPQKTYCAFFHRFAFSGTIDALHVFPRGYGAGGGVGSFAIYSNKSDGRLVPDTLLWGQTTAPGSTSTLIESGCGTGRVELAVTGVTVTPGMGLWLAHIGGFGSPGNMDFLGWGSSGGGSSIGAGLQIAGWPRLAAAGTYGASAAAIEQQHYLLHCYSQLNAISLPGNYAWPATFDLTGFNFFRPADGSITVPFVLYHPVVGS